MRRRDFVTGFAAVGAAGIAVSELRAQSESSGKVKQGRIRQCLTRGVFGRKSGMSFDDICRTAAELGVHGFDLIPSRDWPTLKKYGLKPTMAPPNRGVTIPNGINDRSKHDELVKTMLPAIDECAAGGCPNLITVSGSRRGLTDEQGISACVDFLNRVKARAEDKGVTICMELLNSKVDHPDQQCNHTAWGVEVCKRVNSPRVKLLYDIYHMQIMEGDVCRTIKDNFQWLAHFHTAGVPGRHEIDGTQELNYHFVAETIAGLGFTGYVTHEYRPARDPMQSLRQALEIMSV